MKLLATPNSPYARVVRICAHELGINLDIEYVGVRNDADHILKHNPAAKVPTLIIDNELALSETRLICELLEDQSTPGFLARRDDSKRRRWEGLVTGFLDGVSVWIREARRDAEDQSQKIMDLERRRADRCLDYFERHWSMSVDIDYSSSAIVSGLELITTRVESGMLTRYPNLNSWYQDMQGLESIKETRPEPLPNRPSR